MAKLLVAARRFVADEGGATMVEYALMIVFIALACVATITTLGQSLPGPFQTVLTGLG